MSRKKNEKQRMEQPKVQGQAGGARAGGFDQMVGVCPASKLTGKERKKPGRRTPHCAVTGPVDHFGSSGNGNSCVEVGAIG